MHHLDPTTLGDTMTAGPRPDMDGEQTAVTGSQAHPGVSGTYEYARALGLAQTAIFQRFRLQSDGEVDGFEHVSRGDNLAPEVSRTST